MSEVTALAHASVLVSDTESALRFYRDILGLKVSPQRPNLSYPGAWLDVGAAQIHLLELSNPDPVDGRPAHPGHDRHIAFHVHNLAAIKVSLARANVVYSLSRSGRVALFCRDPDGNGIELIETIV